MARTTPPLPLPVKRALKKLGEDIRDARIRRRIPAALLAQRAMTSHVTMIKVERGDPAVSVGVYANILFTLGLIGRLGEVADPAFDEVGQTLDDRRLPKRARQPAKKRTVAEDE